ncbi:MAG: PEGA domain-containing protein [Geobacteraceae bacterium]|nr:PEGA domain-containing protein [Geobacteraceae bacterium]
MILKCLRKKPEERYSDGGQLASALRAAVGGRETAVAGGKAVSTKYAVPALLLVLVLSVAGGAWYYVSLRDTVSRVVPSRVEEPGTVKYSALDVNSSPPGARVFVDGDLQGMTPLRLRPTQGKHEVRLSLTGYYEWEAQVDLGEEPATPLSVTLVPMEKQ